MIDNTLNIEPITGSIGADVTGVELASGLSPGVVDGLTAALAEHGVLFFAAPTEGRTAHKALADALGQVVMPHQYLASLAEEGFPEISVISTAVGNAYAANYWHSDVTWRTEPSRFSILHMQHGPAAGGDTMWSSQTSAYAALSPAMQAFLDPLTATHQLSREHPEMSAVHPVVIRHPLTGRKSLFVNSLFTTRINELTPSESTDLLASLIRHATQPDFTCRKRWRGGEIAVWDNHFVQHYAVLDYGDQARCVHRIEVRGAAPIPAREPAHAAAS